MNAALIVIIVGIIILLFGVIFILLQGSSSSSPTAQLKTMVDTQRYSTQRMEREAKTAVFTVAESEAVKDVVSAELTLEKKLKYGRWKLPPAAFRLLEVAISILAVTLAHSKLNLFLQLVSLLAGPIIMRSLLNMSIEKRFKAFDADYPNFLMQLVGLLKTGMNPINGIETAAKALEYSSSVRIEVELMLERLRFGVSEDKSIGAFGEDIYHPEIELFVQALLLSRRVGGTLSDTLERLAKQVRRRQYFRSSAKAAIGMQRGAIWFILGIMVALELYLYVMFPEAVVGAIQNDVGWQVWQAGFTLIMLGMYWITQVTKIKV
jgi:tight adherence protein B